MAQNPFSTLLGHGNKPFNNTYQNLYYNLSSDQPVTLRGGMDPELMEIDDEPKSEHQPGVGENGGFKQEGTTYGQYGASLLLAGVDWEAAFRADAEDKEFEEYMRMIDNANAGVAPTPQESFGQRVATTGVNIDAWGPGINGEVIPISLLPLYNDIPAWFRTRKYWARLVEDSGNNIFLSAHAWVHEMVRMLRLPSIDPESLFGWDMVTSEWNFFFLTDPFFTPENFTPEVWISMVHHIRSSGPQEWQKTPTGQVGPTEQGDPANYVSQYAPTITSAAPALRLNPDAQGPIHPNFNFSKKFFAGRLISHPEYWGKCIDDGPKKEGEPEILANARIKWARSNMAIIRRPPEVLIPLESSRGRVKLEIIDERTKLSKAINKRNSRLETSHLRKMNENCTAFDPAYRDAWRKQQKDRRVENNRRRDAAYEHAARYYRYMELPVPPKPTPPEDSDDEDFIDARDPPSTVMKHVEPDTRTNERYRCKPCVDDNGRCSYRTQRYPCKRCVNLNIEDQCVSSSPEIDLDLAALNSLILEGPYIPSFALPAERVEHHDLLPGEWPTTGPRGTARIQLRGVGLRDWEGMGHFKLTGSDDERPMTIDSAIKALKRKLMGGIDDENHDDEPPHKKLRSTPTYTGKGTPKDSLAKAKNPRKPNAPSKAEENITKTGGTKRSHKKVEDKLSFEPCDNCKARGEPDRCEKHRPCVNCVLNNIGHTCDASHQDQPYGMNPDEVGQESDAMVVDTGYDCHPGHPVLGSTPPPLRHDPKPTFHSPDPTANPLGYDYEPMFGGPELAIQPPADLVADAVAPYSDLQDDIGILYVSRMLIGGLPETQPDTLDGIVGTFVAQDNETRQSDPYYRPLTTIHDAEAYFQRRLAYLVSQMPYELDPLPEGLGGSEMMDLPLEETLWQQGNPTIPTPHTPLTVNDVLRKQAQQPHSAAQDLENFHGDLVIRQTNGHEQVWSCPQDPPNAANGDMDWIMTDDPAPLATGNESSSGSYNSFFDRIFQDPDDQFDAFQAEPALPAIPPMAQVTTGDIASALGMTSAFEYPLTWHLGNLREGYDVGSEVYSNVKRKAPCTEDLTFWTKARGRLDRCPESNGIACDSLTCDDKSSCNSCWKTQKGAVQFIEMGIVAQTKAWFCKPCKDALDKERLRNGPTKVRLNKCYCVSQLQETRLCNEDRMEVGNAILSRAKEQAALAVQDRRSARCGNCARNAEDATSGAWRCICCNQAVTLP